LTTPPIAKGTFEKKNTRLQPNELDVLSSSPGDVLTKERDSKIEENDMEY